LSIKNINMVMPKRMLMVARKRAFMVTRSPARRRAGAGSGSGRSGARKERGNPAGKAARHGGERRRKAAKAAGGGLRLARECGMIRASGWQQERACPSPKGGEAYERVRAVVFDNRLGGGFDSVAGVFAE
jgi:hypothetical protein